MLAAFATGNPALVYEEAKQLASAYRELQTEAARLRFKLNFGTPICDNCDGLHAGPQVVATCFQVKLCNYTNISNLADGRLRKVAAVLGDG